MAYSAVNGVVLLPWRTPDPAVLTGSSDGTSTVWTYPSFKKIFSLVGHTQAISCVDASEETGLLATGAHDCSVRLWSAETAFIGHGENIASASYDETIRITETQGGGEIQLFTGHTDIVFFVQDVPGGRLVSGSADKTARVWNVTVGKQDLLLAGHGTSFVQCAAVSPDGCTVSTACSDNTIRVCSLLTGEVHCQFPVDSPEIRSLSISADSSIIICLTAAGCLNLHDLASGILYGTHQTCSKQMESRCLCTPPAAMPESVVVGFSDGSIRSIRCTKNQPLETFSREHDIVTAVQTFEGGVFVAMHTGIIYRWGCNNASNVVLQTYVGHSEAVRCIAVASEKSGSETLIVTGGDDGTLRIWSTESGVELRQIQIESCTQTGIFALSPDNSMLAWSDYGNLFHWKKAKGGEMAKFSSPAIFSFEDNTKICQCSADSVNGAATVVMFTSDSSELITGDEDNYVRIWSAQSGELRLEIEGHEQSPVALAMSPCAAMFASGSYDGTAKIFDLATGETRCSIEAHKSRVLSVSWGSSKVLITGSEDKSMQMFNAKSGTNLLAMKNHESAITAVACYSNGRLLCASEQTVYMTPPIDLDDLCDNHQNFVPPSWYLTWLASEDMDALIPAQRYVAVQQILEGKTASAATMSFAFFVELARRGRWDGIQKLLFSKSEIQSTSFYFSALVRAAQESNSRDCIDGVLSQALKSIKNRVEVVQDGRQRVWCLSTHSMQDDDFVSALCEVGKSHPELLLNFVNEAGLLISDDRVNHGYSGKAGLGVNKYWTSGSSESSPFPVNVWSEYFQKKPDPHVRAPVPTNSLVHPFPNFSSLEFLQALLEQQDAEYFGNFITATVVLLKWNAFGRKMFVIEMIWYFVGLANMVTISFMVQASYSKNGPGFDSTGSGACTVLFGLLGILTLKELPAMVLQTFRGSGGFWVYFRDLFSIMDILQIALNLATVGLFFSSKVGMLAPVLAFPVYLKWLKLYYYLQPWKTVGPLISMVVQILLEMPWFLFIMAIIMTATANVFYLVITDSNQTDPVGFQGPLDSLFTIYQMLFLGAFETDATFTEFVILKIIFVFSTIVCSILLLNLLIAQMSDSFERIQEKAEMQRMYFLATTIARQQLGFSESKIEEFKSNPTWIHVLAPIQRGTSTFSTGDNWLGVLQNIKNHIDDSILTKFEDADKNSAELKFEMANIHKKLDMLATKLQQVTQNPETETEESFGFPN